MILKSEALYGIIICFSINFGVVFLDIYIFSSYILTEYRISIKKNVGRHNQDRASMKSRTVSTYIAVPSVVVYDFASNPANLPVWIPSFCKSVEFVNGQWVIQSTEGPAIFTFVESNAYGVLDHTIKFASGLKVTNPMRVIPNGSGSELMFTLFQHKGMPDQQFKEDESHVQSDLETLRRILESKHG